MLMTCVMRTMRQKAFFQRMDILPQAPFSLLPQGPLPVSCKTLPVIPAGPFLSFPQFLAGIQLTQSFSRIQSGVMSLSARPSMTAEW